MYPKLCLLWPWAVWKCAQCSDNPAVVRICSVQLCFIFFSKMETLPCPSTLTFKWVPLWFLLSIWLKKNPPASRAWQKPIAFPKPPLGRELSETKCGETAKRVPEFIRWGWEKANIKIRDAGDTSLHSLLPFLDKNGRDIQERESIPQLSGNVTIVKTERLKRLLQGVRFRNLKGKAVIICGLIRRSECSQIQYKYDEYGRGMTRDEWIADKEWEILVTTVCGNKCV